MPLPTCGRRDRKTIQVLLELPTSLNTLFPSALPALPYLLLLLSWTTGPSLAVALPPYTLKVFLT